LRITEDGGSLLHADVPVLRRIFGYESSVVFDDASLRLLCFPKAERQFVGRDQDQIAALERTRDGSATDLLPIGSGFLVAHEEVLIVDSCKVKGQPQAVHVAPPHQTGVTERSIGRRDGHAAYNVVYDMVIRDTPDRV